MPKLRTFLALDSADRLATFEAMAALLYAKALVAGVASGRWHERFASVGAPRTGTPQGAELEVTRRTRFAIARALRNVPGSPNCLPQALAARSMLQRRGIEADLFIGTRLDGASENRFHAWLKVGDEWVTGLCDETEYALFTGHGAEVA